MPGRVHLAVLDAFAARAPMVTIESPRHSPEIEYLVSGRNALVLPASTTPAEYAAAVSSLLWDPGDVNQSSRGLRG